MTFLCNGLYTTVIFQISRFPYVGERWVTFFTINCYMQDVCKKKLELPGSRVVSKWQKVQGTGAASPSLRGGYVVVTERDAKWQRALEMKATIKVVQCRPRKGASRCKHKRQNISYGPLVVYCKGSIPS